ncbi:uncharacterized protein LOC112897534 [Panicum hallii]|uniref:uncharacterized protein LOC112897534 n=1 Tax=Panicum hallii TaxID=206008 RepID=UPI000DF4F020|nr:uncharacterized protein LOC112897534 [Panicum hallii]
MGHPEWKKLQSGWPIYLDELDRMFMGVAVDGSSSYVPGDEDPVDVTPNDEEEDSEDDHGLQTPQSTGSKRTRDSSQSVRSTATSPNKKTKSPAVRAMVSQMQLHNEIQTQRNVAMEGFMSKRLQVKQAEEAKMEKQFDTIMEAARDCGVTEDNAQLWIGVLKIAQDKGASYFFLRSLPHGRKALIEHYAREGVHCSEEGNEAADSDEEFENFMITQFMDDSADIGFIYGVWCCRQILSGGLGVPEPTGLLGSLQGQQVPSPRVSKRQRTLR